MPNGRDSLMMTQSPDGMALGAGVQMTPDAARLDSSIHLQHVHLQPNFQHLSLPLYQGQHSYTTN